MNTNRRTAIKYFVLLTAGAAFLPSCKSNHNNIAAYNNIPITEDDQAMLGEVAETIVPATGTPGAKEVSAHLFALQMLNDCYNQEDRDHFVKGMKQFNDEVQKKYSKPYQQCTPSEREAIITAVNAKKDNETDADFFFKTMKQLTVKGYTESKYYLTNVQVYKLVPGKYIASKAV